MSTYYYMRCDKCKQIGGFFSRQAWGWGNADIVETFKFMMLHTARCGHQHIRVISEHDDQFFDERDEALGGEWLGVEKAQIKFLEDSRRMFPCSCDWKLPDEKGDDIGERWYRLEMEKALEAVEREMRFSSDGETT